MKEEDAPKKSSADPQLNAQRLSPATEELNNALCATIPLCHAELQEPVKMEPVLILQFWKYLKDNLSLSLKMQIATELVSETSEPIHQLKPATTHAQQLTVNTLLTITVRKVIRLTLVFL